LWLLPLGCFLFYQSFSPALQTLVLVAALAAAPLPVLWRQRRNEKETARREAELRTEADVQRQQLAAVRQRVGRLRDELRAANEQARLSHQLTILGQFTAGFLHEYNNPLAIVVNRLEILLDERNDDAPLCKDLEQMLTEARYMSKIAQNLLRALRHERGIETFDPCVPSEAIREATQALDSAAEAAHVKFVLETSDVPRVEVPEHTVSEVIRSLISNAIKALDGIPDATIWLKLDAYRSPGAKIILRVEDNGKGVAPEMRDHLFEPFASQKGGKENVGLGLFLAASLLETYDGALRYEPRNGGGASFVVEMPAARYTRDQPFHWFVKGDAV
jgi:two-component system C4-dicarboxylate transport sensor histidine kinase DctB